MAIEKMVLLNLVGSLEEEHALLEQLVLCENIHLNLDNRDIYDNNYVIHQYEAMIPSCRLNHQEDYLKMKQDYSNMEELLTRICASINIVPQIEYEEKIKDYSLEKARVDLEKLRDEIGDKAKSIQDKRKEMFDFAELRNKLKCIQEKHIDLKELNSLHYFEFEIGLLSKDNKVHIKKNYENISAIVHQIGEIQDSREDIYIIIYPTSFKVEIKKLLKSLNWVKLEFPVDMEGTIEELIAHIKQKKQQIFEEIKAFEDIISQNKAQRCELLNKIFTRVKLEQKILEIKEEIMHGNNLFMLNAWITKKDKKKIEQKIGDITDKFVIIIKEVSELDNKAVPPTKMKNNWLVRPFETIVKLYGLPAYNEIDPTPFLAITFCLMFGMMFGDIGQGLIYFIAGVFLHKKNKVGSGLLTRLGASSILFGFIYGSLFGLEHEQLPWLPSLIGSPLSTKNIPLILLMGLSFGIIVLSLAFLMGILTALKSGNIEEGIFGKNGVVGYVFYLSLILAVVSLVKLIPITPIVFVWSMVICLVLMVFKEPLANLFLKNRPYIKGDKNAYFIESSFEGIETILSALSNAISFIRVGAFALNHAGLFLAFLVMSEMTDNIVLKGIILVLGNILILSLEGLVVFIQGLRLQYYEMFSKYFKGDGIAYQPIKLTDGNRS